jgi:hypothetical protein
LPLPPIQTMSSLCGVVLHLFPEVVPLMMLICIGDCGTL